MEKKVLLEKIAKKQDQIVRKQRSISKLEAKTNHEWYDEDDLSRRKHELEDLKATLSKYNTQLERIESDEKEFTYEIPEAMKQLKEELKQEQINWMHHLQEIAPDQIKFYSDKCDELIAKYDELSKTDKNVNRLGYFSTEDYAIYRKGEAKWKDIKSMSEDKIVKDAEYDSTSLVLNCYNRVKEITGRITDHVGLRCTAGNMGAVLNGLVIGEKGTARVESIEAGGYNIQCRHIRVLVHEVKK